MDTSDDILAVLQQHLGRAEQALLAIADGRSMCAIGRSGRSFPAAKYHEGAVAALAEVRRNARRQVRQDEAADVARLADAAAASWRERAESLATWGGDWRAYHAGGVDALERLLDDLTSG